MRAVVLVAGALAVVVPAALAWPGPPASPAPKPPAAGAPPPAWIESQTRSAWLAYGSFCWSGSGRGTCVDMIPPQTRPDLPVFATGRGGRVRVHLRFAASSVEASIDRQHVAALLDRTHRIVSWRARRAGILTVFAKKSGDASYVARLRLR